MNFFDNLVENDLCTGCGICEGMLGRHCLEVTLDKNGFLRPNLKENISDQESTLLSNICPGLNVTPIAPSKHDNPLWGCVMASHIATAADKIIKHIGSSGGVLSALQVHLLQTGQVDYILGTSAANHDPLNTEVKICRSKEDILNCAGSRYSPSAPLKQILTLLDLPGNFAFVGKPCDVAALRRYGQYDKRIAEKVRYFLSFFCAGVPSRCGSLHVIQNLGVEFKDLASFKYRGDGWPGLTLATLKDGSTRSMSYIESWGNILGHYLQWRCKLCPDGSGEFADISCGDAWHLSSDGTPDFSEHEGRSFILARSPRGLQLIQDSITSKSIHLIEDVSLSDIETVQCHQAYRRRTMLARYLACACLGIKYPKYNMRSLAKASQTIGCMQLLRVFIGSLKRGLNVKFKKQ